jgi:hypothetical protein
MAEVGGVDFQRAPPAHAIVRLQLRCACVQGPIGFWLVYDPTRSPATCAGAVIPGQSSPAAAH